MKPILSTDIPAFDAIVGTTIDFIYSGNTPNKNELIITDANGEVFYQGVCTTRELSHVIPSSTTPLSDNILVNKLENRETQYYAKVRVEDNGWSEYSDRVSIYCYLTPEFGFTGFTDEPNQVISNSYIDLPLYYNQEQDEKLAEYEVILYDHNKKEIYSTGIIYYNKSSLNRTITIEGLEDTEKYFIRAIGTTSRNRSLDTGYLSFTVNYSPTSTIPTSLILENDCKNGYVKVTSNIIYVSYESSDDDFTFINGDEVSLENGYLSYNNGFNIDKDFTLIVDLRKPQPYKEIINLSNGNFSITVSYMLYDVDEPYSYFVMRISDGYSDYVLHSDDMKVLEENDDVRLYINRKNGMYDFSVTIK